MALFLATPETNRSVGRFQVGEETPIIIDLTDENSIGNIHTPIANEVSKVDTLAISSADRRQKELEESEMLAWQLMQEESMQAYEMQVDYMRNNPDLFSEEEIAALNTVLEENRTESQQGHGVVQGEEEEEEEGEEDSSEWTYERLLELGQLVGG
jgi:hypothetical protein